MPQVVLEKPLAKNKDLIAKSSLPKSHMASTQKEVVELFSKYKAAEIKNLGRFLYKKNKKTFLNREVVDQSIKWRSLEHEISLSDRFLNLSVRYGLLNCKLGGIELDNEYSTTPLFDKVIKNIGIDFEKEEKDLKNANDPKQLAKRIKNKAGFAEFKIVMDRIISRTNADSNIPLSAEKVASKLVNEDKIRKRIASIAVLLEAKGYIKTYSWSRYDDNKIYQLEKAMFPTKELNDLGIFSVKVENESNVEPNRLDYCVPQLVKCIESHPKTAALFDLIVDGLGGDVTSNREIDISSMTKNNELTGAINRLFTFDVIEEIYDRKKYVKVNSELVSKVLEELSK